MSRLPQRWLGWGVPAAALLGALAVGGCLNPFDPRVARGTGISDPPPVPNNPQAVLRLFEWCWNHRAVAEYREIFTDDYRFVFAFSDSSGNFYRDRPFTREDELAATGNLFRGGSATEPPANSIALTLDRNLFASPTIRYGKRDTLHLQIPANVVLRIETDAQSFQVTGVARMFVVRGDSAVIPQELLDKGFTQDPNRWYIYRWEDETLQSSVAQAVAGRVPEGAAVRWRVASVTPTRSAERTLGLPSTPGRLGSTEGTFDVSWGFVKRLYARP